MKLKTQNPHPNNIFDSNCLAAPDRHIIMRLARRALDEDLGTGDVTTNSIVDRSKRANGYFLSKEPFILAGMCVVEACFRLLDRNASLSLKFDDGNFINKGEMFAFVEGNARALLGAERVALNFLQRLSGIATLTREAVNRIQGASAKVLDTRKTTPLLRYLEKYAVQVGGGFNHRLGLDDGILIKENHIKIAGGIAAAIQNARNKAPHLFRVEVEVTDLEELQEALSEKAEVILLDNMTLEQVRQAVSVTHGKAQLEVSGGITLENIREYALTGVQFISIGELTHSFRSVDISFEIA